MKKPNNSVISLFLLYVFVILPLTGGEVLQSSVSIDFSTPLLAVALSEPEVIHQTQRIILAPSVAGEPAGSQLLNTSIPAGEVSFTVDGSGAEVNLMATSDVPMLLTLIDSEGELLGSFLLSDTEEAVLGPLNSSRATYEVLYDLIEGESELADRSVRFTLR